MSYALPETHREVQLASRPDGPLDLRHFRTVTAPLPQPTDDQLLVRNRLMAVTSVMRSLMEETCELPIPVFGVGETMMGPTVGEVISPGRSGLEPGSLVLHHSGWREFAAADLDDTKPLNVTDLPDPAVHLSQAFAAWVACVRGAEIRPGDTVFVSGAAGGVGSLAGQFARLRGAARVIGSVGSQRKAEHLVDRLGYDAAVLRDEPLEKALGEAAPDGIDAVIDNVGGEQLSAALSHARKGARVAAFGTLGGQAAGGTTAPVEIDGAALIARGITLRGTLVFDHLDCVPEFETEFGRALRAGTVTFPHTLVSGIEQAPRALCELLAGRHIGSVLVEF